MSWLGAWALLLGFQDLKEPHHVGVLPCLRPSEEDMLDVFQCWARIAAAAEVRWSCWLSFGGTFCALGCSAWRLATY